MSHADSASVRSTQHVPHVRVRDAVRRHLAHGNGAPAPAHVAHALQRILRAHARSGRALALDSGCGTGAATRTLAATHPGLLVVGVDRSLARLAACLDDGLSGERDGALFVRTDAALLWRALREAGVRLARHWLLYPNPWPKRAHYLRRWPSHPAFADLVALGGVLELRCNWHVYAQEMALALATAGIEARLDAFAGYAPALTPFERKYRASGHALWRVAADLDARV